MLRTPAAASLKFPGLHLPHHRLPIEYPDYQLRLGSRAEFNDFSHQLDFIHNNGYVVLPGAVDTDLCDMLAEYYEKVDSLSTDDLPVVEYWGKNGSVYGQTFSEKARNESDGKFKMVDLFATNNLARKVCFSPVLEKFLSLIFGSDILAFQQLGFIYGTEQPIHQDTAYVRVSRPRMLAASWVALEDIKPDTGELEFIPGSHRFDCYRFNSKGDKGCEMVERDSEKSIWFNYTDDHAHGNFLDALSQLQPSYGIDRFHAKKGDALIWISFFAHGGSSISSDHISTRTTRKSLVTHYCPFPEVHPMYFHDCKHIPPTSFRDRCYFSSKTYPLENLPDGFSSSEYLKINPDVLSDDKFREDPGLHYLEHGRYENRKISSTFE